MKVLVKYFTMREVKYSKLDFDNNLDEDLVTRLAIANVVLENKGKYVKITKVCFEA